MNIVHYQIFVSGRVQGVGYRAFASRLANNFALKGFVKNMPDGSVYIEAEGEEEILDQFVHQCKQGPGWANVAQVKVVKSPPVGHGAFHVRY